MKWETLCRTEYEQEYRSQLFLLSVCVSLMEADGKKELAFPEGEKKNPAFYVVWIKCLDL